MKATELMDKIIFAQLDFLNKDITKTIHDISFTISYNNAQTIFRYLREVLAMKIEDYKTFKMFGSDIYVTESMPDNEILIGTKITL